MPSKVTKFSGLLSSKTPFGPLTSPLTPSSQFATVSTTDESSDQEGAPVSEPTNAGVEQEERAPTEAPVADAQPEQSLSDEDPPTVSEDSSSDEEVEAPLPDRSPAIKPAPSPPPLQFPPPTRSTGHPPLSSAPSGDKEGTGAVVRSPGDAPLPPEDVSLGAPSSLPPEGAAFPPKDVPGAGLGLAVEGATVGGETKAEAVRAENRGGPLEPPLAGEAALLQGAPGQSSQSPEDSYRAPFTEVPPLPETRTGSVFNLSGLDQAFPMKASGQEPYAVMSSAQALDAASQLGATLKPQSLRAPQTTRLPDGSVLLTAPTQAVTVAHVSAPCAQALSGIEKAPERLLELLKRLRKFDLSQRSQGSLDALAAGLRALKDSNVSECDPRLRQAVDDSLSMLGKTSQALGQQTAVELTYVKHLNEFRAAKSDLKALSDVLKTDAARVAKGRAKTDAYLQRRGVALGGALAGVEQRLRNLLVFSKGV